MNDFEKNLPLGKSTTYKSDYDPALLCPVPRSLKRDELGLDAKLPFSGFDLWNAYELSWLNPKGKPVVALGEFRFSCVSPCLIESKSFKLYLNSFNQTRMANFDEVRERMVNDLSAVAGGVVEVRLMPVDQSKLLTVVELPGECIDELDIGMDDYALDPLLLQGAADSQRIVTQELHSHLLKSNCLVTGQPDWGSVLIRYRGSQINPEALLRYLVSFRQHNEFHEQCVERIFTDLMRFCQPELLTVYARYTRRGGLDINPFRSNYETDIANLRQVRQ